MRPEPRGVRIPGPRFDPSATVHRGGSTKPLPCRQKRVARRDLPPAADSGGILVRAADAARIIAFPKGFGADVHARAVTLTTKDGTGGLLG